MIFIVLILNLEDQTIKEKMFDKKFKFICFCLKSEEEKKKG